PFSRGFSMKNNKFPYLIALAAAASFANLAGAGDIDRKRDDLPPERNLAVELNAPGAVRLDVQVYDRERGESFRYELGKNENGLIRGGILAPPGKGLVISLAAYDGRDEAIYKGEGVVDIGEGVSPEFDVKLEGRDLKEPLAARFGGYL